MGKKKKGSKLANDLSSPGSANAPKHVVIVMDGLKEFNTELLEWVLVNIVPFGHKVTLLGFMPWLNIPCKYIFMEIYYFVLQSEQNQTHLAVFCKLKR